MQPLALGGLANNCRAPAPPPSPRAPSCLGPCAPSSTRTPGGGSRAHPTPKVISAERTNYVCRGPVPRSGHIPFRPRGEAAWSLCFSEPLQPPLSSAVTSDLSTPRPQHPQTSALLPISSVDLGEGLGGELELPQQLRITNSLFLGNSLLLPLPSPATSPVVSVPEETSSYNGP